MKNELIILYESGLTIRECAERVNLSYESVRQILKQAGIKWRKKYISDLLPKEIKNIVEKFDNNIDIKSIALQYNISSPAISRILRANNRNPIAISKKYDILRQTSLNTIQKQIIVGTVLGDGCLTKTSKNSNFRLSFSHYKKHEQYFHWKIAMLDPFINTWHTNIDKRGNSIMLQTSTINHQDLNYFGNMFYQNNKKTIPNNLDIFLTPLALATWIQDDGTLNMGVNMKICSQGFTEEENYKLRNYLRQCFDLRSKVMPYNYKGKKYFHLTLNKENTQKLSDIIRPYIVDCMKYKLMSEPSTTLCLTPDKDEDKV